MSEILVILNPAARSTRAATIVEVKIGGLPRVGMPPSPSTSEPGKRAPLAAKAVEQGYRVWCARRRPAR